MTHHEDISALRAQCASLCASDAAMLLATQDPVRASLVLR